MHLINWNHPKRRMMMMMTMMNLMDQGHSLDISSNGGALGFGLLSEPAGSDGCSDWTEEAACFQGEWTGPS